MTIQLSVLTIGYETAGECRSVIRDLQRQSARDRIELLVVAPDQSGLEEHELSCFPAWRWVTVDGVRTCGDAMAAAVTAASAPFVTYAEEHSTFDPRWAERLIAAHAAGYDAVGFAMENANPATLTSWAHLYGQFGPVVAPVASGESPALAGHHASYRRSLLLEYGALLPTVLEDEAALVLDLRRRGRRLYIAGDAVSRHVNISRFGAYMRMDYLGQRSFASSRVRVGRWPRWKRLAYAAAVPLIPLVRLRRVLGHIRRSRRDHLMPRILVPISCAVAAGAWGEMLGYLVGGGDTALRKAPVELQRRRFIAAADLGPTDGSSGSPAR